jgi:hypothetical protein
VAVVDCKEFDVTRNGDTLDSIVGHLESSFQSLINHKNRGHEPSAEDKKLLRKRRNRVSYYIKKKTDNMDAILHMRIPILGSDGVKVRADLYHDLLDLQIKTSAGLHLSSSVYANDPNRSSLNSCDRASVGSTTSDSTTMTLGLCHLLIDLQKNDQRDSELRQSIRFHLLQYLLGLDERW